MPGPTKLEQTELRSMTKTNFVCGAVALIALLVIWAIWNDSDPGLVAQIIFTVIMGFAFLLFTMAMVYGAYSIGLVRGARHWYADMDEIIAFDRRVAARREKLEEQLQ